MLTIIWQCRVAANLQFVNKTISVQHDKTRYACLVSSILDHVKTH